MPALEQRDFMSYVVTGTDSAGALSLKRDSAAAAIKKARELMGDGCRDVPLPPQMAASTVIRNSTNSMPLREREAAATQNFVPAASGTAISSLRGENLLDSDQGRRHF
jgi:hypothetical protein